MEAFIGNSLLSKMDSKSGFDYGLALSTRQAGCNNIKKTITICSDYSVSSLSNSKADRIVTARHEFERNSKDS